MQKILFGIITILFIGIGYIAVSSFLSSSSTAAGNGTENSYTNGSADTPVDTGTSTTTTNVNTDTTSTSDSAPRTYTLAEVAQHSTQESCWTAVGDSVYDLSSFVAQHPGGERNIMKICGVDGTALFEAQHGSTESAQSVLASLKIGTLRTQ